MSSNPIDRRATERPLRFVAADAGRRWPDRGARPAAGGTYSQGAKSGGEAGVIPSGQINARNLHSPGIIFELDGQQVEARARRNHLGGRAARWARTSRTCATSPSPVTGRTATAAPAWSRSKASACWRASCKRVPGVGMKVKTATERANKARAMVMELLVADQPERATSHDPTSHFWQQADFVAGDAKPLPICCALAAGCRVIPAMRVNLDSCIQCNLCVRACREVQVNDVIGMAYRSHEAKIVFDFDDPMGAIHLRRLRRMRAGVPDRRAHARGLPGREPDPHGLPRPRRWIRCVPTAASAARSRTRSRMKRSSTPKVATVPPTTTACA